MEIILSIIGIVLIVFVLFIITGLLGWGIHYLGAIVGFLAQASWGCIGCLLKILAAIFIFLVLITFFAHFFEIFPSYYYIIKV